MDADETSALARRFIALPVDKRRVFWQSLQDSGIDFSLFPIPAGLADGDSRESSYAQRRMWLLWKLDPETSAYHLSSSLRLTGALDPDALERALVGLQKRHEVLRSTFHEAGDALSQCVHANAVAGLTRHDFTRSTRLDAEVRVHELTLAATQTPFNLETGPLLRADLFRIDADEHVLSLVMHHIVWDGWSLNVLVDELARLYEAHRSGTAADLPTLPVQYSDYALWQRRWLEAGEGNRQLAYWTDRIGNADTVLDLPTDRPRPAVWSYRGVSLDFAIPEPLASELKTIAQQHRATLFMALLAAFKTLLYRWSGQSDLRVGVPVANRNRIEIEGLIGFFVNTQVLRSTVDGRRGFDALIEQVKDAALGAQAHQDLPFEQIVEALQPQRSLSHNPLFQVMFNHAETAGATAIRRIGDLRIEELAQPQSTTQFDLMLNTRQDTAGRLHASIIYATDLFNAASIERLKAHLLTLLHAIAAQPARPLDDLPLLSEAERHALLVECNDTRADYDTATLLPALLRRQAEATPGATALIAGDLRLTYRELHRRANKLAHWLTTQGVGPDVLVEISAERSAAMVIGLLAIMKAGGAYVPLDPEYPAERIADMAAQSGIRLLLTQQHLLPRLPQIDARVWCLDRDWHETDACDDHQPTPSLHPHNLAYCIFTSGSTGRPKGVGNSHAGMLNRLLWMQQRYALTPADRVLQKTPFSFDVSVWEFFWPLISGAALVMAEPGAHRDPALLREIVVREGITTLHFVPSMLQAFIGAGELPACHSLRQVMCSGEALSLELQRQFTAQHGADLHNLYGPTEAAIDVTAWACRDEPDLHTVPIGRPIANTQIHILDANLEPIPIGVVGEIYIGGVNLARGYVRRADLTAERFVPDPFGANGARLYRSGDLARRRTDGAIDYVGRIDHQVKIRGFRIELGEIEARLADRAEVRDAVVVARDAPSGKQLIGYVVANVEDAWLPERLKRHLHVTLPEYMVPAQIVVLPSLPLSPSGKLDRKALPDPQWQKHEQVAPTSEPERRLCRAWGDVLGLPQIGVTDNFFELGGDSIAAIQVVSRARQLGLRIAPRDLFQHQTVRALAQVARADDTQTPAPAPPVGEAALLPIQHWFFEQPIAPRSHWNQAVLLRPREPVDRPALERAIRALLEHHDALRLRFRRDHTGSWRQAYAPPHETRQSPLREANAADAEELAARVAEGHAALDIEHGPVLHAQLIRMGDASERLLLVIHHLVVDGVSWRILLEDLQSAYRQAKDADAPELPARTSAYADWTAFLAKRAQGPAMEEALHWWEAHLGITAPALPVDFPEITNRNRDAAQLTLRLGRAETALLLKEAPQAYRTRVDELLLAALARTLCDWSGGNAALVQLEGHGRDEQLAPNIDLSHSVGWFTSLYPVRLEPGADSDPGALIKAVKEQLRAVPDTGLSYGLLRHLAAPEIQARMRALPSPQVTFNYLGQFDASFGDRAAFVPASESSGDGQAPDAPMMTPLTLDAQIYDGELSLVWGYSRARYRDATIRALADDCRATLLDLIAHCASADAGGVTPSDFPLANLTQQQLDSLPFPARRIEDVYPLAPMQEGLLMHTLREPASGIYLMQEHYLVESEIDPPIFFRAWEQVLERNAAMRATFHWNTGGPAVQAILRDPPISMTYLDWLGEPAEACEARLADLLEAELHEGFDLGRAPPFRLRLIRFAPRRFCFVISYHHILMDAWSRSLLLDDLLAIYRDLVAGANVASGNIAPYRDFIAWLNGRDAAAARTFWQHNLEGFDEPTPLPGIHPMPLPVDGLVIGDCLTFLDEAETRALQQLATDRQLTVNTFVQAAWSLLLHLHSGRDDVLFGVTVAGRPADIPALQRTVGLFISTIPLRIRLPHPAAAVTVGDWLATLQAQNLAMREYEHVPLVTIGECSELPRGTPLFDSLFVFESAPVHFTVRQGAEEFAARADKMRTHTNYPLTVVVYPDALLGLHFSYDHRYFDEASMAPLLSRFKRLLLALVTSIDKQLHALPLIDDAERRQLLETHNATQRDYPLEHGYSALFEESVTRHHDRIAASCAGETVSYGALNRQANRLGHALIGAGVRPDDIVAVLDERGLGLLAMILGAFKAGAGYLAFDPEHPPRRIAEIIGASGARVVLCRDTFGPLLTQAFADLPPSVRPSVLSLEELADRALPDHNPGIAVGPRHLAYVIYTSGSTGTPKGVMVEQAGMLNNQLSKVPYLGLTADDVIAQTANQGFDISVWQFLAALLFGARVEIVPDAIAHDPAALLRHVTLTGITVLESVPTLIHGMLLEDGPPLPHLRWLLPTGEALPPELARQWCGRYPHVPLVNAYGPAECSDDVALHGIAEPPTDHAYLPIGAATDNNRLYILGGDLEPLPVGAVGELFVAGTGVGRGYLGAPAQTAEAFLPDPFATTPGERLYRTGDLARRRPDGLIEYVGRADQQVKIRGFRIELGEIEARLLEHHQVREAAVIVREAPLGRRLVGYVAADTGDDIANNLQRHLKERVPEYMVPAQLVVLDRLPRNPNGKLDRKALPAPEWQAREQVLPRTDVEHRLAAIWAELLRVDRVGITDDFYELGGHSLLLTQLVSRVRGAFAVDVPLTLLFETMTVERMAERIEALSGPAADAELDLMAGILDELEQVS